MNSWAQEDASPYISYCFAKKYSFPSKPLHIPVALCVPLRVYTSSLSTSICQARYISLVLCSRKTKEVICHVRFSTLALPLAFVSLHVFFQISNISVLLFCYNSRWRHCYFLYSTASTVNIEKNLDMLTLKRMYTIHWRNTDDTHKMESEPSVLLWFRVETPRS